MIEPARLSWLFFAKNLLSSLLKQHINKFKLLLN